MQRGAGVPIEARPGPRDVGIRMGALSAVAKCFALFLLCCSGGAWSEGLGIFDLELSAEAKTTRRAETGLGLDLTSEFADLHALIRTQAQGAEALISYGYSSSEGSRIVAGTLKPGGRLALLLDPLAMSLGSFDAPLARPDSSLSSARSGLALGAGPLDVFGYGERGKDGAERTVAGGVALSRSFEAGTFALSAGLGRSIPAGGATSWYGAPIPGSWPRALVAAAFSAPRRQPSYNLALLVSSAIDRGTGTAFRLSAGRSFGGIVTQALVAARSPGFAGWEDGGMPLARGAVDASLPLGQGMRLGLRWSAEAREESGNAPPRFARDLKARMEGMGDAGFPLFLRAETEIGEGPSRSSIGQLFVLGFGDDPGFTFEVEDSLEWGERVPFLTHPGDALFFLPPPDSGKARAGLTFDFSRLPGDQALSFSASLTYERPEPFAASPSRPPSIASHLQSEARLGARGELSIEASVEIEGVGGGISPPVIDLRLVVRPSRMSGLPLP